jgi:TPR repeat protein
MKHRKKHKKECRRLLAERKSTKQAQDNNDGERKIDETTTPKKEMEEEGDECPICLEILPNDAMKFSRWTCCGKGMHRHCFKDMQSMKMSGTCPFCRAKTPTSDEEAVKQLRPWVKKKKAWAQILMSQMYRDGTGVERSYKLARRLKELAAQQGDVGAMYDVASMYAFGEGVEQSYETAKEYYEQAAHLGHASSLYNLGDMYEIGKGVEQSYKRAKEHYEQAAHLGHAPAQLNLGCLYVQGQGVEQSSEKARKWWAMAAAQRNEEAIDNLEHLNEMEGRKTMSTTSSNTIICSNCGTPQTEHKLIRCPCHSVQYCSKQCQKKHRKQHKKECRRLLAERN